MGDFLFHLDPCRSVTCKYGARCVGQNGKGICACNHSCPAVFAPICGDDVKTYGNPCLLNVSRCVGQRNVTIAYNGKCSKYCAIKCNSLHDFCSGELLEKWQRLTYHLHGNTDLITTSFSCQDSYLGLICRIFPLDNKVSSCCN